MTKILVVDDEQDLCEILRFNLESEGFEVSTANSAEEAFLLMDSQSARGEDGCFALVLLDVMMDKMSGFEMARQLRGRGDETPIIFLTAKEGHEDQLAGFSAGGDDYITKPFFFDTVLARVKAVLKRSRPAAAGKTSAGDLLTFGTLTIDCLRHEVADGGRTIELTRREYEILCLLTKNADSYFSREAILGAVWPDDSFVNYRGIDVHIARLRKKLGVYGRHIVSRTGFGYSFKSDVAESAF